MIKSIKQKSNKIEIDLTGPDGNAFVLLGYAKDFCKQLELDYTAISKDMKSGDYEHLLAVFEKHFGSFVTMYR
jgi:hypothetical protein